MDIMMNKNRLMGILGIHIKALKLFFQHHDKQSLILELIQKPFNQDTSKDPIHQNFEFFIQAVSKIPNAIILELGSRNNSAKKFFKESSKFIGFDIHHGLDVDVMGDIHELSKYFPANQIDAVLAISVFEHLALPWIAIQEINKILKKDGLLFISTHQTWPLHNIPCDYWRYSKDTFKILLSPIFGFEILKNEEGLPCSILPYGNDLSMKALYKQPAFLAVNVIARKVIDSQINIHNNIKFGDFSPDIYPK
jgi:SAM-dependent methyltransferase